MSMLLTICALHFVAQLSPGPDVLLVAKSSASTSRANTLKIILGISAGVLVWVILTLLGFTVLLEQWPWIQQVLMLIGGFFLARMGYAMLKGGIATLKQRTNLDGVIAHEPKNYFLWGLFTNLANPKIVIYFSSVFSLALSSSAGLNLKPQLAVIIPIQTFLVFSLLMLVMSIPKIKAIYQRSGSYIDILSGSFFLLFAVFLWVDVLKIFY
ncbi:LysE family transporter [Acinetobacter nematophilus]|uniref:LysE family transporter n=1 Tax=Acinetobacter nematophilus TaxID=2994642 RepID=A0A9X3DWG3_9GAMM|nr:LysE family transporter [Acinetobacter nematophilus]MCX5469092.1 LysE family transporter [Acinetobacter nematophilus]